MLIVWHSSQRTKRGGIRGPHWNTDEPISLISLKPACWVLLLPLVFILQFSLIFGLPERSCGLAKKKTTCSLVKCTSCGLQHAIYRSIIRPTVQPVAVDIEVKDSSDICFLCIVDPPNDESCLKAAVVAITCRLMSTFRPSVGFHFDSTALL